MKTRECAHKTDPRLIAMFPGKFPEVCGKRFRPTHEDQTWCPKCGGEVQIKINADQTVKAAWTGPKNRGSLMKIAAQGNAEELNKLTWDECAAVYLAVKHDPFPLDKGSEQYTATLALVKSGEIWKDGKRPECSLGDLRAMLLKLAGDGFNAPTDSYIRIAVEVASKALAMVALAHFAAGLGIVGDFLSRQMVFAHIG